MPSHSNHPQSLGHGLSLLALLLLSLAWALMNEVDGTLQQQMILVGVMMGTAMRLLPHSLQPQRVEAQAQPWAQIKDFIDETNLKRELEATRQHLIQEEEEEW